MCTTYVQVAEEDVGFREVGVSGSYELHDVSAGTQTSSKCL